MRIHVGKEMDLMGMRVPIPLAMALKMYKCVDPSITD
jgi:hypothetical protein